MARHDDERKREQIDIVIHHRVTPMEKEDYAEANVTGSNDSLP